MYVEKNRINEVSKDLPPYSSVYWIEVFDKAEGSERPLGPLWQYSLQSWRLGGGGGDSQADPSLSCVWKPCLG